MTMTFDLARALANGACMHCSTEQIIEWHTDCPFAPEYASVHPYQGRDHSVTCIGCFRRKTWRDDARCAVCAPRSAASRGDAGTGVTGLLSVPASSSLSGTSPAARDAQQCAAGESPAPLAGNP